MVRMASIGRAHVRAYLTRRAGGDVIEVKVAETSLTDVATVALRGPAASIVPERLRAD